VSQLNVLVIHIRAEQAEEYERAFAEQELPRWLDYQARGKFISARMFRSQYGTDERTEVVKFVLVVEVPSMEEHHQHDSDQGFQTFDRLVEQFQPEHPLVYGGDLIHSVG
jgi:hypothetical protein